MNLNFIQYSFHAMQLRPEKYSLSEATIREPISSVGISR